MSYKNFFSRKNKQEKRAKELSIATEKVQIIEKFITAGILAFDAERYQVAMLDSLWKIYAGKKQINLCNSLVSYCSLQNAYNKKNIPDNPTLTISLKREDMNDAVIPYCFFQSNRIAYIK